MGNVNFSSKNVYKSEKSGKYFISVKAQDFKLNDSIVFKCQFPLDVKTINFKDKKTNEDKSFKVGSMVIKPVEEIGGIDEKYLDEKYKSITLKFSGKILEHLENCEPTQEYKIRVDTFEIEGKEIKYLVLRKFEEKKLEISNIDKVDQDLSDDSLPW